MKTIDLGHLPAFLQDQLSNPPKAGEGVNPFLFNVSRNLHAHYDERSIYELLAEATSDCGRIVGEPEIMKAINGSKHCAWRPNQQETTKQKLPPLKQGQAKPRKPKWPEVDEQKIAKIVEGNPNALEKLRESSPVTISPERHDPDCLLEILFPGNPILCVARGIKDWTTDHREDLPRLEGSYSHIVPSPMSKLKGTNQAGNPSSRCLDNTGKRTYLITEFDQGTRDEQSAIITHLDYYAPLTMVVDSAGKSLHAWWCCDGASDEVIRNFFSRAVSLGADKNMWPRCQLARLPLGTRPDPDRIQEVVFFNHVNAAVEGGSHA